MKFLLATITLGIVFAMNRFHEDHFKKANIFFKEIVYKNTTEVFHVKKEIRKFIQALNERQKNRTQSFNEKEKNRTRSLNEIECTKIFYEYIKNDHLSQLSDAWNTLDFRIFEEKKISRKFRNEMKTKLKPYLKTRAKMAFGENSLCENNFLKITFSTTTSLPPVGFLQFLSSKTIYNLNKLLDFFNLDSQKLLRIELRVILGENFNIKSRITFSTYTGPHYCCGLTYEDFPKLEILNVEIRLSLRKTKEDETENNLMNTKDEQNWELTGKHFLNTLYILILIFAFKSRFHVIIDFNCQNDDGSPMLVRFQIIRIHYKLDLVTLNLVTTYELVAIF